MDGELRKKKDTHKIIYLYFLQIMLECDEHL